MDDLLASFSGIALDNKEAVVTQFSRVLGTDHQTAQFFLESHQNDIARAVDAYLQLASGNKPDAVTAQIGVPSAVFEDDQTWDPKSYLPNAPLMLVIVPAFTLGVLNSVVRTATANSKQWGASLARRL